MSWRTVLITKHCKLDYSMGYLVIRSVEQTSRVHLSEISLLIVETTACSITVPLMNELLAKKIKVVFCDERHNPAFELTPYYGCHDSSLKLRNQLVWAVEAKQAVWTAIVAEKIRNQSILLKHYDCDQYQMLDRYLAELEFNDQTNREGHAAKVYFNALFGKDFSRGGADPANSMLNYGYSLLLSVFNREVISCGYLTQLGLFHDNRFNQYNLSCDLMEPFRPYIDSLVRSLNPQKFEKDEKILLLNLLHRQVIIEERKHTLLNSIKLYCKSVFHAIEQQDPSLIHFTDFAYEL